MEKILHPDLEETFLLKCGMCHQNFDLEKRTPRLLPGCGHTICSTCLEEIKEYSVANVYSCPFDGLTIAQNIDSCPINFTLADFIKERARLEKYETHIKPLDYLCLTEKIKICTLCVIDHIKKNHDVEQKESSVNQFVETIKQIDAFREDIKIYQENLFLRLEENHQRQIECIKNECNKLRAFIDKKEEEIIFDLVQKLKNNPQRQIECIKNECSKLRAFIDKKEKEIIFESKYYLAANEFKLKSIFDEKFQMLKEQRAALENILPNAEFERENICGTIRVKIQNFRLTMDQDNLMPQGVEIDQKYNSFKKSVTNTIEELERSLNNAKMPDLLDNWNEIVTTFSDKDIEEEENISGEDGNLSSFSVKSDFIIQSTPGVLKIEQDTSGPNDMLVELEKWKGVHTIQLDLIKTISQEDLQLLNFIWKRIVNSSTLKITLKKSTYG